MKLELIRIRKIDLLLRLTRYLSNNSMKSKSYSLDDEGNSQSMSNNIIYIVYLCQRWSLFIHSFLSASNRTIIVLALNIWQELLLYKINTLCIIRRLTRPTDKFLKKWKDYRSWNLSSNWTKIEIRQLYSCDNQTKKIVEIKYKGHSKIFFLPNIESHRNH